MANILPHILNSILLFCLMYGLAILAFLFVVVFDGGGA